MSECPGNPFKLVYVKMNCSPHVIAYVACYGVTVAMVRISFCKVRLAVDRQFETVRDWAASDTELCLCRVRPRPWHRHKYLV